MLLYQIILLALIQGLTEFLPISSSAHLILPSQLLNWPDQGLAFDLAVHVGTLLAVLVYLRRDIGSMILSCLNVLRGKPVDDNAVLSLFIVLATIPAIVIGFFIKDFVASHLRSILVIALASIGFGILLAVVDKTAKFKRDLGSLTATQAVIIGLAQAIAFIPGTSRSGITITAALALGYTRQSALRFSFLLSIPLILAGGSLSAFDLYQAELQSSIWLEICLGIFTAGISAFLCIKLFMHLVDRLGMLPFVIYRVLLGLGLLVVYFAL